MKRHLFRTVERYLRWTLLSALGGVLSGLAAAAFLILLEWATSTRDVHPQIIWLLPAAGLAIGWMYHRFGKAVESGSNLILDEIHDPRNVIPARMAPFILLGTVLTHLFGGSAGREGTAVQMGASLSDQLTRFFQIEPEERKVLLVAGAGAGFGAAIGAPWAGAVFGMEVIAVGRLRLFAWFQCLIASFAGYYSAILAGAHHSVFPRVDTSFELRNAMFVVLAGVAFGLAVRGFVHLTHFIERLHQRLIPRLPLRPFVGGLLLIVLYKIEGSYRYAGLGLPEIQHGLRQASRFSMPALKAFFTALTVGSGFKGGEFIPLVFVGTTLGSALSVIFPVPVGLLGSVGFAAVFAGAANTPIACTIMAIEIFGLPIAPYAFLACFVSYYASGPHGIYKSQRVHSSKHEQIRMALSWLGELPKRFVK